MSRNYQVGGVREEKGKKETPKTAEKIGCAALNSFIFSKTKKAEIL
jgi:hypothetical protein